MFSRKDDPSSDMVAARGVRSLLPLPLRARLPHVHVQSAQVSPLHISQLVLDLVIHLKVIKKVFLELVEFEELPLCKVKCFIYLFSNRKVNYIFYGFRPFYCVSVMMAFCPLPRI